MAAGAFSRQAQPRGFADPVDARRQGLRGPVGAPHGGLRPLRLDDRAAVRDGRAAARLSGDENVPARRSLREAESRSQRDRRAAEPVLTPPRRASRAALLAGGGRGPRKTGWRRSFFALDQPGPRDLKSDIVESRRLRWRSPRPRAKFMEPSIAPRAGARGKDEGGTMIASNHATLRKVTLQA